MIKIFINNLHTLDAAICIQIFRWNGLRIIDKIMAFISHVGDGYLYVLIGAIIMIIKPSIGKLFIPAALIAYGLEVPSHILLKKKIKRRRPCDRYHEINNLVSLPDEFSFPSGHTAAAFCMAALLAAFFPAGIWYYYTIATLIGLSRVYNGVHYPGDVLAGMVIGMVCTRIGLTLVL